jgi:hypothetical protein
MHAAILQKTASNGHLKTHNVALLHSLRACMTAVLLAVLAAANSQAAPPHHLTTPPITHEQTYQNSIRDYQAKYDADLVECAKHIATAQCKRQARLSKDKSNHEAKLLRANARSQIKKAQQAQKVPPSIPKKPIAATKPASSIKRPMVSPVSPPKGKHLGTALSAQPTPDARRAHVAKQVALEETLVQRKTQANTKKAQREAKNQKRLDLGYPVDARPGPP